MIPDYQSFMLPILRKLANGEERRFSDICEELANDFELDQAVRSEMLASGNQPVYVSRIGWARTYLAKAGLLESSRRGIWRLSDRGRQVLASNPTTVNNLLLQQFEEFRAFTNPRREAPAPIAGESKNDSDISEALISRETPEESLAGIHAKIDSALRLELLTRIKAAPPAFFERLVVELMLRMGYGGSREDAGQVVGKSGDGGIDGVIKQDRLGLDTIYLQAKRWDGAVSAPAVRDFVGALAGHRAKRGVFITTSSYTKQAFDYVASIEARVILIDGEQLATLMIEHDLGVSPIATYVVKRVDGDYFEW